MNRGILPDIVMGIGLQGLSTTDRSEMATEDAYNRQSTNWKGK